MARLSLSLLDLKARRAAVAKRYRPRKRIPQQRQPDSIRLGYFRDLRILIKEVRTIFERYSDRLSFVVNQFAQEKAEIRDAEDPSEIFEEIQDEIRRTLTTDRVAVVGRTFADRTAELSRREFSKQVKAVAGVDVFAAEPWLGALTDAFISENTTLIKSVPKRMFDEVERTIGEAIRKGERWEATQSAIRERFYVAESRAKLIARDQIGKLYGQMNEQRQKDLGVDSFIWRTVNDNRVREEHANLEGQVFKWSNPPAEGIPGEPINCRCHAEPNFGNLLASLEE